MEKHSDKDGVFKGFMNVSSFLQRSGTWSISDTAYWNISMESFELSFLFGDPFFINNDTDN